MSHSRNSSKSLKGYLGDYIGSSIGLTKGDTRSLDCSSCEAVMFFLVLGFYVLTLPCTPSSKLAAQNPRALHLAYGLNPKP